MKILWLSNSSFCHYGYSRVTKEVCAGIRKKHEVVVFGIQTMGRAICDEYGTPNWPLNFDIWGSDALHDYIKTFRADLVVSALDLFMREVQYIGPTVKQFKIPWVAHITVGSDSLSPYLHKPLMLADMVVAPSKFNYGIVKASGLPVTYIPHGVDTNRFYPLKDDEKQEIKRKMGLEGKFTYLVAQRNNILQKNFFGAFWGFKMLIENSPEARRDSLLLLLSYPFESNGVRLTDLAAHLGIQDYVRFVHVKPSENSQRLELANFNDPMAIIHRPNWGLDELAMNELYNAADVSVIPSLGESASLPCLESQACGVPVIMSSFSTGPEMLIDGSPTPRGAVVKIRGMWDIPLLSRVGIPDEGDMASKMYQLFLDDGLRERMGKNGAEFIRNNHDWKKHIVPEWLNLLEEFGKPRPVSYPRGEMGI